MDDMRVALLQRLHASLALALVRLRRSPGDSAVHAVRVAARRLRSLLRALRDDLHPTVYAGLQFDLKNLGRTLAPLREAAIRRHLLRSLQQSFDSSMTEIHGDALRNLDATLAQAEQSLQTQIREILPSPGWEERVKRIQEGISGTALLGVVTEPAQRTLLRALNLSAERVVDRLKDKKSSPGTLHRVRLAVKRARYLADISAEALATEGQLPDASTVRLLRRLQRALGDLNDLFQLRDWFATATIDARLRVELARELEKRLDAQLASFRKLRKSAHGKLSGSLQTS